MTIGKDYNTDETIKTRVMRQAGRYMAAMWKQTLYPVPYEDTFIEDGVKVQVIIQDAEADAHKRLDDLTSDRSSEA